ncbi:MAG: DUF1667 domain-containing protein [Lachnotalea sp.]
MEVRELICIGCPIGCMINVELEDGTVKGITGYTCPRGEQYARKEVTNPTRLVTSTVRVLNGNYPVVSVKTSSDIPKGKIMECIDELENVTVTAPIHIGDILVANVADTNCDVIATKQIKAITNHA